MRISHPVVFFVLPFLALAIPLEQRATDQGIAIPIRNLVRAPAIDPLAILASDVARSSMKIQKGVDAYLKNTGNVHPHFNATKTSTKRFDVSSVSLTEYNYALWGGSVQIGLKELKVVIDTGSPDTIVPSPDCGTSCLGHTLYAPSSNSTYTTSPTAKQFKAEHAFNDTIFGSVCTDNVRIGSMTAERQTIGAATVYPPALSIGTFPVDAILGLAFGTISSLGKNVKSVVETLVDNKVIEGGFGLYMAEYGSELYLGATNSARHKDGIVWRQVQKDEGFWRVQVDGIQVNGHYVVGTTAAIFDTGITTIIGDLHGIKGIAAVIGGVEVQKDQYTTFYVSCDLLHQPKIVITVVVGTIRINIPPATYITGYVHYQGQQLCTTVLVASTLYPDTWIMGNSVLRGIYSAWDVESGHLGFADLA